MMDFIELLRAKPEHTRKQLALAFAGGITGLVAFAWVIAVSASGTFSLAPTPSAAGSLAAGPHADANPASALIGAFSALTSQNASSITVVETHASSTLDTPAPEDRTVIPF